VNVAKNGLLARTVDLVAQAQVGNRNNSPGRGAIWNERTSTYSAVREH